MASFTIEKRKTSKGALRYRCVVRVKKGNDVVYRESRTFGKKADAKEWGTMLVSKLEAHGIPGRTDHPTIREVILLYLNEPLTSEKIGRSKRYGLNMLVDTDLAKIRADKLTVADLVSHCKDRKASGAKPQTIAGDISYLRSVFKSAKPVFNIDIDDTIIQESYYTLYQHSLIAKSERRSRRPRSFELDQIRTELKKRQNHKAAHIPFLDILDFSILSCMRIGEVCKILWDDVDEQSKAVKVRDRKDPRKKEGNHMWVPLLGEAWDILQRQPKTDTRIFPYNSKSVSAGFQRIRSKLGIEDLRYHDLRREGASRLFEQGFSIEEVAQVTGHRNLNTLWQIYTELFPNRVHEKFNLLQRQRGMNSH
ncbi:site-specific integrase [Photobacterium sp. TLY01]|uniref:tyrosine-type recombinase/integrase n=1 Tax=Photobacterium sp. TLY01 TaxID=2907534 RepID=UPI001F410AAE|nr:site-specific integrase [Photobacterium sp. TLY01]UIP27671.1 site-specific integrase [Photobacterium sp. TLY01]